MIAASRTAQRNSLLNLTGQRYRRRGTRITQILRLAGLARGALNKSGPHAVDDARRSFCEIRGLLFGALAKQPGFWVARFESLAEDRHLAVDKALHDELARAGETAIRNNDVDGLRKRLLSRNRFESLEARCQTISIRMVFFPVGQANIVTVELLECF